MIAIIGPTASGKTSLAVALADKIGGEIISADSRQVYRGMDIGTGKDIEEYQINEQKIPYHLIDIHDAGYEYNVFEFQRDFLESHQTIVDRNKIPILCGGTGMYIEAALGKYKLIEVPRNETLRNSYVDMSNEELLSDLSKLKKLHNTSDSIDRKRIIRALEIEYYYRDNKIVEEKLPEIQTNLFAIQFERSELKKRITKRLKQRLNQGMIAEVEGLIHKGLSVEQLKFYGLEYKFLALHVSGELSYNDMYQKLNSAIHQFAKRQMTWFRRMEKRGFIINWMPSSYSLEKKMNFVINTLN